MKHPKHIPYEKESYTDKQMLERSQEFLNWADQRRSVRDYTSESIPLEVMENILETASTAPSGAHKQPWTFCLISNKELKLL